MVDDTSEFSEYRKSRGAVASDRAKHFMNRSKYFTQIKDFASAEAYQKVANDYAQEAIRAR